jgi:hypothetical protein
MERHGRYVAAPSYVPLVLYSADHYDALAVGLGHSGLLDRRWHDAGIAVALCAGSELTRGGCPMRSHEGSLT